jgi:predicted HTH transcriptional regulator
MPKDNGSPAIKALREEIAAIEKAQQPTHDKIAALQQELEEGQAIIARNEAAIAVLEGNVTIASPRSATRTPSGRSPRGSVTDAIMRTVGERPGVSAAEVANVTGAKKQTVTSALQKLAADGRLEKVKLDGSNRVGYKLP